jgi:carboxymethylenebutenolidase
MKKLFSAILPAILFFGINTANAQNSAANSTPKDGGMIKFHTNAGPDANAFYVPADMATDKVLIIFHEWYGLNNNIKTEAQNWQKKLGGKVAVYAVDLFDGKVTTEKFAASKLMNNMDQKRGEAIVKGLLDKVGNGKQIATIGWGIGGTWAFTASVLAGSKAAGCVMNYGYPIKDKDRISLLKTDVMYHYGNYDEYITRADVDEFVKDVTSAGRGIKLDTYNGYHDYSLNDNTNFQQTPTMESNLATLKFLKHKLALD